MASLFKQDGHYYLQFYHKDRQPSRKRVALKTTKKRDAESFRSKLERDYLTGAYDPWTDDAFTYDREIKPSTRYTLSHAFVFDLRLSEKASIVVGGSYGNYFLQYQGPLPIASFQMRR